MDQWKDVAGNRPLREGADRTHLNVPLARVFKDSEIVRLACDFESPDGRIAKGTVGTILQVFDHGAAYQVEFEGPHELPETIPVEALEPSNDSA